MSANVAERLASLPVRNAKAALDRGESDPRTVQKMNPEDKPLNKDAGEVLDIARAAVRMEPKAMAEDMGVSHSLVLRGLKSDDGLSFHKLWELSDEYWAELMMAVAQKRRIFIVRRTIEVPERRRRA